MTTLTPHQVLAIAHCKSLSEVKRIATQLKMDYDEAVRVYFEMETHWNGEDPPSKYREKEGEGVK